MCRLFGLISSKEESAEPWLVRSDRSLLAQANVSPETAQKDGWGIGWFEDDGRARVVKGTGQASLSPEREQFVAAAESARAPVVIGHLRHASNPLNLPPGRLIGLENSQPFEHHTVIFAHNGAIPFPTETRPMLGVHESMVKGVNDSEVLFWLLFRNTEEHADPLIGFAHTVEDLARVAQGLHATGVPPYSGLNVLYSRGPEELWGFCLWTGDHGTGLFDHHRRYYEMTYQSTPHRLVIGSEPFDGEPGVWKSLPSGSYIVGRRKGAHVEVSTGKIPIPEGLTLQPPAA